MAMLRKYICPGCEKEFSFLHHPSSEPPPRYCPLCGYDTRSDETLDFTQAVTAAHIGKATTKAVDGYYRATEEGAAFRAELTGDPTLKVTDIPSVGPGEIAVRPVQNEITRFAQQAPQVPYGYGGGASMGPQYSTNVGVGPVPNRGARMRETIRQGHRAQLDTRHPSQAGAQSDLPALETTLPGYRRRA